MVSAGGSHTVLLRSDGSAVAFGINVEGQCNIPKLEQGVSYTQVSAGFAIPDSHTFSHTVLLRSDGRTVACGYDHYTQCQIPALEQGRRYESYSAPSQ